MRRCLSGTLLALGLVLALAPMAAAQQKTVVRLEVNGAVDPLVARTIARGLREARERDAAAVLIRIDTPGGLSTSMRSIVQDIAASRVPVVCWVGPPGARAASAGAVIALGCPATVMASGTSIGAAHPVGFRGEILDQKITNDAAAYARAIAERWGRNGAVAEQMVRSSLALGAQEAVRQRVADLLADDEQAVLRAIDGRSARPGPFTPPVAPDAVDRFHTAGATIVPIGMDPISSLLHGIVDPNVAYLLLLFGLLGVAAEILTPGFGFPGIGGGIALAVAAVILGMLPVNVLGVVLIVGSVVLFIVEAHVPGGLAAAAGFVGLLVGGFFLFDASIPAARVSRALLIATTAIGVAFFLILIRSVMATRRAPVASGTADDLLGRTGEVVARVAPEGVVRVGREEWTATTDGQPIDVGSHVLVAGARGFTLIVEPVSESARPATEATEGESP